MDKVKNTIAATAISWIKCKEDYSTVASARNGLALMTQPTLNLETWI